MRPSSARGGMFVGNKSDEGGGIGGAGHALQGRPVSVECARSRRPVRAAGCLEGARCRCVRDWGPKASMRSVVASIWVDARPAIVAPTLRFAPAAGATSWRPRAFWNGRNLGEAVQTPISGGPFVSQHIHTHTRTTHRGIPKPQPPVALARACLRCDRPRPLLKGPARPPSLPIICDPSPVLSLSSLPSPGTFTTCTSWHPHPHPPASTPRSHPLGVLILQSVAFHHPRHC